MDDSESMPEKILQKINRTKKIVQCGAILVILYNVIYTAFFTAAKLMKLNERFPWIDDVDTITSLVFIVPFRILESLLIVYLACLGIRLVNILAIQFKLRHRLIKIGIVFVALYILAWENLSLMWWIYPYVQAYRNEPCSVAYFMMRNACIFMYCWLPFVQGLTISFVVQFIARDKEERYSSVAPDQLSEKSYHEPGFYQ